MTSLCTCIFVYVCARALVLRFSSLVFFLSLSLSLASKEKDDDAVLAAHTQKRPDRRELLSNDIYFFSKKKMFITDAETSLSIVAFVLSLHPLMARFSRFLTRTPPPFFFLLVLVVFFFLLSFSFSLPVMSNLRCYISHRAVVMIDNIRTSCCRYIFTRGRYSSKFKYRFSEKKKKLNG